MHFVYVLVSVPAPAKVYIGTTTNLIQRVREHNQGASTYSRRYAPWELRTYVAFSSKQRALAFERYLKHGSGHAFLKKRLL